MSQTTSPDGSEIKEILDSIRGDIDTEDAMNKFRKIFCDRDILNFEYDDTPIYTGDYDGTLEGEMRSIAKTEPSSSEGEPFYVIYAEASKILKTTRRKMVKDLLIDFGTGDEEGSFILILRNLKENVWEIITYAYIFERTQIRIYRVGEGESTRTLSENLDKIRLESPNMTRTAVSLLVEEAFKLRPVEKEFYEKYKQIIGKLQTYLRSEYERVLESQTPIGIKPMLFIGRAIKSFSHTLLNRMMFILFLQKKGWMAGRKDFLKWLYEIAQEEEGEFYKDYLRPLFLDIMNTSYSDRTELLDSITISEEVKDAFREIAYFNGGLFTHLREFGVDLDEIIISIDNEIMEDIMTFLLSYNFTVSEDTPFHVEVAVDPAMLGHIYESLIAEQERGSAGIFYTPREEVDFMCRMALYERLSKEVDAEVLKHILFSEEHIERGGDEVIRTIEKLRIVDPAAGSGAFLVGMFNVIREIYEKTMQPLDYEVKKTIIRRNIYGVDVKEWAVRVAELRLWLALIEDEDSIPEEEPLLPTLAPNLMVGDSLVWSGVKIDGEPLNIDDGKLMERLKKHSHELAELKEKVFNGELSPAEFAERRRSIFIQALRTPITTHFEASGDWQSEGKPYHVLKIEEALEEGKRIDISFLWELDFAEVFKEGGFDIVIANPPYVRQEMIYPEFYDPEEFTSENLDESPDEIKKKYKDSCIENTKSILDKLSRDYYSGNFETDIAKRSDIYAYFFMKGLDILKKGANLVFITSNSWLDVDYGTWMQEAFLKFTDIRYIFDYPHRSFEDADVNTVITVLEKKETGGLSDKYSSFVKLKKAIGSLGKEDFMEILDITPSENPYPLFEASVYQISTETARYRLVDGWNLARLGGGRNDMDGNPSLDEYSGAKWGGLLIRAPDIFYTILERGKDKLVKLEKIADVKRGFTTGANEFFYLQPIKNTDEWPVCEICGVVHSPDEGLIAVKNRAGWEGYIEEEFLKPVIKNPRELKKLFLKLEDLKYMVLMCSKTREELKGTHILRYIEWGENKGYHSRPTCKGRTIWWNLGRWIPAHGYWMESINDINRIYLNVDSVLASDKFYYIIFNKEFDKPMSMVMALNSTIYSLFRELKGFHGMGEGVLKLPVYEVKEMQIVLLNNVKVIPYISRDQNSIFEELGLPKPNRELSNINPDDITLEDVMPDRRELDRIIFEELGLSEDEQLEVYKAVVQLVKERLVKAKTVGGR